MAGKFYDRTPQAERAYLVGAEVRGEEGIISLEDSLSELALLADTAGLEVVGQTTQKLDHVESSTFIRSGKVEEVRTAITTLDAQVVIFDDELSPRHNRELEKTLWGKCAVIRSFCTHSGYLCPTRPNA